MKCKYVNLSFGGPSPPGQGGFKIQEQGIWCTGVRKTINRTKGKTITISCTDRLNLLYKFVDFVR